MQSCSTRFQSSPVTILAMGGITCSHLRKLPEQHEHALPCTLEVCLSVDSLARFQVSKKDDPDEGVAHDEDEHAHDNEEALVNRDTNSLHEHAQGGVLPGYG